MLGYRKDTKMINGNRQIVQKRDSFQKLYITETLRLILNKKSIRDSIVNFNIQDPFEPIF